MAKQTGKRKGKSMKTDDGAETKSLVPIKAHAYPEDTWVRLSLIPAGLEGEEFEEAKKLASFLTPRGAIRLCGELIAAAEDVRKEHPEAAQGL